MTRARFLLVLVVRSLAAGLVVAALCAPGSATGASRGAEAAGRGSTSSSAGFQAFFGNATTAAMSPTVVGQANIFVDGQANIFLAGRSVVPPDTDGILPPVVPLGGSETVLFGSVEGTFSCCSGRFPNGPDGGDRSMFPGCCDNPPYRGISGLLDFTPRGGYLVGVFLNDTEPADPPPPSLDFTRNYDFSNLSPLLRQVFFIGDGRDASGEQQRFHVPAGATRLFLGQVDGQGEFFDNTGGFRASLTLGETDQADLTLNPRDSPDPVGVGDPLLYSTFVANNGPGGARNVTLTDTLPASVTFDSAHTTRGTCDKPAGRTVVCHLGSFALGGRAVVEILVTPNAVGRIKNTVEVESDTPDPVSSNNVAGEKTTVSSGTATATFDASGTVGRNIVTLEALRRDGHVVATDSVRLFGNAVVNHYTLSLSVPRGRFHQLRVVGSGRKQLGTFFAVIDTVSIAG
jgi:uncharacterized repeat protein (TIGR01451 family)